MRQKCEADALRLIGLTYDTAMSGHDWTDVLKQIALCIEAKSAMLRMVDYTKVQINFFDAFGIDAAYREAYSQHFVNIDIYRNLFETAPIGIIMQSRQIPGYEKRHNTEFFNDYQKPQDMEYVCGSVLARNQDLTIQFGAHRSKSTLDFGQCEFDFLQTVLPHMVRALQMRRSLAVGFSQQALAEAALNKLQIGLLLTDAQAKPIFINQMAEHHITASNGALKLSHNELRARKSGDIAHLRRLVVNATSTTAGKGLSVGGEMRIACDNGSFLQLCVTPLSRQYLDCAMAAPSACAVIFISRPGNVDLDWHKVATYYELTPAEAKLAVQLANGKSLEEVAEHLDISIHTARSHLKAIFAKTNVKRQSELVAILLQGMFTFCKTNEN